MIKNTLITSFIFAIALLIWTSKDFFHPSFEEISKASFEGLFFWLWSYFSSKNTQKKSHKQ